MTFVNTFVLGCGQFCTRYREQVQIAQDGLIRRFPWQQWFKEVETMLPRFFKLTIYDWNDQLTQFFAEFENQAYAGLHGTTAVTIP